MIPRRAFASLLAANLILPAGRGQAQDRAGAPDFAPVRPGRTLSFPADHGAHPDFRTEWWYVTGWLQAQGQPIGFQITFFRIRTGADTRNPSAFAPTQVIFAHAAISDPAVGRLIHAQRIARAGFGLAQAKVGDMALVSMTGGCDGKLAAGSRLRRATRPSPWISPSPPPSRRCCRATGDLAARDPAPTRRATITACRT